MDGALRDAGNVTRMSTQNPFPSRARRAIRAVPRGDVVASFAAYAEAQQAVDGLIKAEFPVDRVAIVGSDLKTIEQVTGKLTWGRVALAGAASGAWLGLFLGVLFGLFSSDGAVGLIGAAVLIGAGFGMLFGVVSYAINRRRKDFTSLTQVLAGRYDLIVDPALSGRARVLLEKAGVRDTLHDAGPGGLRTQEGPDRSASSPVDGDRTPSEEDRRRPARPRYGEYLPSPHDASQGADDPQPPPEGGDGPDGAGQEDDPQHR